MSERRASPDPVAKAVAAILLLGLAGLPPARAADPATAARTSPPGPMACAALKSAAPPNVTITLAEPVSAGGFRPPGPDMLPGVMPENYAKLPAFCRVAGTIRPTPQSDIRFELWLPAQGWNGKFLQAGNGGAAGSIVYGALVDPLARGYAVANTDTGHRGGGGDFSWAAGQPEKVTDYAWRAVHELTLAGKALTRAHYGSFPRKSYWFGCSTGGRQGLKEAQRFPDDYDGIVAGAPAANWSPLMSLAILTQKNLTGPDALSPMKLGLLKEAAIARCDAKDGVTDRVIGMPSSCDFDPAQLQCAAGTSGPQCLAPAEVAAAKRIYAGVVTRGGVVRMPGTGPASEPLWGAYASPMFSIGTSYFRHVVAKDPQWDPAGFDLDRDLARAEQVDGGAADAMDPDISKFVARGGKLLTYHGTADGLIPYGNTVNYHHSVVAKLGAAKAQDAVRLYLVPGMDHCSGGEGAHAVDWLTPLEHWVEHGQAPGTLAGTHPATTGGGPPGMPPAAPTNAFTRPVCPYPQLPVYRGSGDPALAESFRCEATSP
jgi:feruloyl esterase